MTVSVESAATSRGTGRGRMTAATPSSGGSGPSADRRSSAMSASAIGWRRSRFIRTILGMKVLDATVVRSEGFAAIPDVVLGPLAGRPEADWHRAPPGRWTPAQIVHHLAISIDGSGRVFEERRAKPPMRRRPRPGRQRLAPFLYPPFGGIPSRRPAAAPTEPAPRPGAPAGGRAPRQ